MFADLSGNLKVELLNFVPFFNEVDSCNPECVTGRVKRAAWNTRADPASRRPRSSTKRAPRLIPKRRRHCIRAAVLASSPCSDLPGCTWLTGKVGLPRHVLQDAERESGSPAAPIIP